MECGIGEQELWSWIDRQAPELQAHLDACPRCRARAKDFGRLMDGVADVENAGPIKPESIGGYRILRLLGTGGMGAVWEAQQEQPRRRVALKIVHESAFADEDSSRFFRREVQTLARLAHPGIGRIYDAGRSQDGRGWLAMELVEGEPLTVFAATRQLGLRSRLRLFLPVCLAVQHAHERGVIHRDLKPANILAGDASPASESGGSPWKVKVLDFGLAKLVVPGGSADTILTRPGQVLGTLPYMSPEQFQQRSEDLDIRTDIYSLGVILYELLCGRLPIDLAGMSLAEAAREVAERTPEAPGRLRSRLRGDLEAIILKAMAKEAGSRYPSAAALAEDIERYLQCLPVAARPPSALYQAGKFVLRHRLPSGLTAALMLVVVGAGLLARHQAREAGRARDDARFQETVAVQVRDFLKDMLGDIDPYQQGDHGTTLDEMLSQASGRIDSSFVALPEVRHELHAIFGELLGSRGHPYQAVAHFRRRLELARQVWGKESTYYADGALGLGAVLIHGGDALEGVPLVEFALERHLALVGEGAQETASDWNALGVAALDAGRTEKATGYFEKALLVRRAVFGEEDRMTLEVLLNLATARLVAVDFDGALPLFLDLQQLQDRAAPGPSLQKASIWHNLGYCQAASGEPETATRSYREALKIREELLGPTHYETLSTLSLLGFTLSQAGKPEEGAEQTGAALASARQVWQSDGPKLSAFENNHASALAALGRHEEAARHYREALRLSQDSQPPNHPEVLRKTIYLAQELRLTGALEDAAASLASVLQQLPGMMEERVRADIRGRALFESGELAWDRGDLESASRHYRGAAEAYEESGRDPSSSWNNLGAALVLLGRPAEAVVPLERAVQAKREASIADGRSAYWLGLALLRSGESGRVEEARGWLLSAAEEYARTLPEEHRWRVELATILAELDQAGG